MTDPKPGAIVHVELSSKDPVASRKFFTDVFGWKFKKEEMGGGPEYWTFDAGSGPGGGLMEPMPGNPPGTLNYILVESVEAAEKKIVAHGGKIMMPRTEIPTVGWFTIFEVPGGVVSAVYESMRKS